MVTLISMTFPSDQMYKRGHFKKACDCTQQGQFTDSQQVYGGESAGHTVAAGHAGKWSLGQLISGERWWRHLDRLLNTLYSIHQINIDIIWRMEIKVKVQVVM